MTSGRYGLALRQVGRLLGGGTVGALGAGQLLERFAVDRDEAAFEALVGRHGPMVLGTCRRMLADPHDVDDAFQATFLVLARKAGSIRDADRLGPWLHGVARRVATRSRALSARRRSRERPGVEEQAIEPPDALEVSEHRAAIDEELSRLPEKYRAPLVLCYLEGLTHDEAAEQLRWPVGTVRSRLAGARDRLRDRLTRRGLAPTAVVPAILTQTSIPQALLSTTVRLATSAGAAPAHVASLAKGALIAMMWDKFKVIAAVGLMAGLTVGGAGVAAQKGDTGKDPVRKELAPISTNKPAVPDQPGSTDPRPGEPILDASLIQLIANPDRYDGKPVRVLGFLHVEFEGTALYLSRDDANYLITRNGLWISFERSPGPKSPVNRKFVLIEGTFDKTLVGHMGSWSGGIRAIRRVEEATKFYND